MFEHVLEEMRISGLGVIEDAVLELSPGLTVVTGETGAGKTMVVQGVNLLFGGRADGGRVRPGSAKAVVEGRVVLREGHPALARAAEAGAELDDGALLVTRTVSAEGRSRAHLGGRGVPVGVLTELSEHVVAVHGQSDQQRLLRPAAQRSALDRYAGEAVTALRQRFREGFERWRDVRAALHALQSAAAERLREAELLRLGLVEVEGAALQPGEDGSLKAEVDRLANADDLRAAAAGAQAALTGDEAGDEVDALGLLTAARRALEAVGPLDPALAGLGARVTEAAFLVADVAGDLASYLSGVDADPLRLSAAQERLAALTSLVRRHGVDDVDGVIAWAEQASVRLHDLDGADDRIAALTVQEQEVRVELAEVAVALSAARTEAATRFGDAVGEELSALAMPHARVTAVVAQTDDPDGLPVDGRVLAVGPDGVDGVELLLVPHPGAPPRPLHKGASGGELSRVMLAVEVVLAGSDPVPVMVFDEVDAGVGGRAAVEIGRRLARLARDHQVLVVTHLPQVAAFADQHLQVVKADDGSVTRSGVVALDDAARVVELSRMMAGHDSGLARGHAEELLAAAAQDRALR
ncbi:MAG: recN [Frankiales bacterium]|nr:recN [Frankiales bacterium]